MALQLPPDVNQTLQEILREGPYSSEAEVMAEALQLLRQRDLLRAEIQAGLEELDRGEGIDGDIVLAELRAKAEDIARRAE